MTFCLLCTVQALVPLQIVQESFETVSNVPSLSTLNPVIGISKPLKQVQSRHQTESFNQSVFF